jgi:predicted RNA-binding protein
MIDQKEIEIEKEKLKKYSESRYCSNPYIVERVKVLLNMIDDLNKEFKSSTNNID